VKYSPHDQRSNGKVSAGRFSLAQVGGCAARPFAKALVPLKLSSSEAGILRILARTPGINRQELAQRLGMHASLSLSGAAIAYWGMKESRWVRSSVIATPSNQQHSKELCAV
jgi:hypothetical protein